MIKLIQFDSTNKLKLITNPSFESIYKLNYLSYDSKIIQKWLVRLFRSFIFLSY